MTRATSQSSRLRLFGRPLPNAPVHDTRPDWQQCEPAWIRGALARSQSLPSGGWYALDATRAVGEAPRAYTVMGRTLVVFRSGSQFVVGPDACPHMGASLSCGRLEQGHVVCPWHGLRLGPSAHVGWAPLASFDDGVLLWVCLPGDEMAASGPYLANRPTRCIESTVRIEVACDPRDIIANRLDPWHGVHYHPHAFRRLRVIDRGDDEITVRVAYRVVGSLAVEVDARFHCPDPRTIVMTIIRGEAEGSVVETHATPMDRGKTAVIEATLATSDRWGFVLARRAAALVRPILGWASRKLWIEDAAYAERLYALRRPRD